MQKLNHNSYKSYLTIEATNDIYFSFVINDCHVRPEHIHARQLIPPE